jgi:group I intron endonuclease
METIKIYPKKAGIYKFTCIENGKVYIGKSVDIRSRLNYHKRSKGGYYFQNALFKYGWDAFNIEILEIFEEFDKIKDNDSLLHRESYYIELYDSTNKDKGYNICKFSTDKTGIPMLESVKEKLRKANLGRPFSEEHRYKIGSTWRGRTRPPFTEEHKENIRKKNLGKKLSQTHKDNIGKANKDKIISEETKEKMSKSQKGKKRSQEIKDRMSRSRLGKPSNRVGYTHSKETKEKMSKNKLGKTSNAKGHKHSEESKEKMRQVKLGKRLSEETKDKMRQVKLKNIN